MSLLLFINPILERINELNFMFCIAASKLGIQSPPPYLSLSINDDAILRGVNYASGGAGILNDTGLYFVCSFSLLFYVCLICNKREPVDYF